MPQKQPPARIAVSRGAEAAALSEATVDDAAGLDRTPEAGPAGPRIELVLGREQRLARGDVDVEPVLVVVPEGVAERRLGAGALRDLVLGRRQRAAELLVGGLRKLPFG